MNSVLPNLPSLNLLTVIMPCYNESENIPKVIPDCVKFSEITQCRFIIVNDGSRDNSLNELLKFKSPKFSIICHSVNRGYGAAVKTGIKNCSTQYCITVDADGQHNLYDIFKLLELMQKEQADLIIGNRQGKGSNKIRNLGKLIIYKFTKLFFRVRIKDLNSGMKLYNTSIAKSMIKWAPDSMAYSDVITLLHFKLKYKILETDITINERLRGKSTINWKTAVITISEVAFVAVNLIPFRFFSIISLIILVSALLWGLPFAFEGKGITVGSSLMLLTSLVIFLQGVVMELLVRLKYENYEHINPKF